MLELAIFVIFMTQPHYLIIIIAQIFFYIDSFITPDDLISNNLSELRKNKDVKTNDYGQKLVNLCKTSGLVICNGRVNGDLDGNFTYVDKKGNSTIDYALVSRELLCNVNSFSVHAPTVFSDHNPIILSLKNIPLHVYSTQDNSFNHNFKQYKWSNEKSTPIFMSNMNDDFVVKNLDYIIDVLDTTVEKWNIPIHPKRYG